MKLRNIALFVVAFTYLQSAVGQRDLAVLNVFYNYINITTPDNSTEIFFLCRNSVNKRVVGNPYLDRQWKDALLISRAGNTYQVKSRYRTFDDEFQIQLHNSTKALFPHLIHGIIVGEKAYMPAKVKTPSGTDYAFFEVLSEGDMYLLRKIDADSKKTDKGYIEIGKTTSQLYYMRKGEIAKPLKQRKRHLTRVLGDRVYLVNKYMSTKHFRAKSDQDVKALFDYYNSL